jgi:hypothetical protein
MIQVHVTLSSVRARDNYCPGQPVDAFLHNIAEELGERYTRGGKKARLTVVEARRTSEEADIQILIRHSGEIHQTEQIRLPDEIHKKFVNFPCLLASTRCCLSVEIERVDGTYKLFG